MPPARATLAPVDDHALNDRRIDEAARLLLDARRSFRRVEALPAELIPASIEDAYRVQWAGHRLADEALGPWKVGATTVEVQGILGVDGPILGRPPADRVAGSGAEIVIADWFAGPPVIETEIGLTPLVDLVDIPADPLDLASMVEVRPCIELVNSRFADMTKVGAASLIADNSVASAIVQGDPIRLDDAAIRGLDQMSVRVEIDGFEAGAGVGAMALGHPLNVLHLAATDAAAWGTPIQAGQLVITGTCTGVIDGVPGMHVVGHFDDASVDLRFA